MVMLPFVEIEHFSKQRAGSKNGIHASKLYEYIVFIYRKEISQHLDETVWERNKTYRNVTAPYW